MLETIEYLVIIEKKKMQYCRALCLHIPLTGSSSCFAIFLKFWRPRANRNDNFIFALVQSARCIKWQGEQRGRKVPREK